jgi:hypothetical protein
MREKFMFPGISVCLAYPVPTQCSVGGLRQLRSFEKLKPKASLGRGVYCRGRCWGNRRLSLNHR